MPGIRTLLVLLATSTLSTALLAASPSAGEQTDQQALWDAYQAIHESLAADSVEGVAVSARNIATHARTLGANGEHATKLAALIEAATALDGNDLARTRTGFETLSDAMISYAEAADVDADLYYCSMKKASWLQPEGEKGQNPYYGSSMLACGVVVEEEEVS